MRRVEVALSFKSRLELFLLKLPMEWKLRSVFGFKILSMLKELFFPKKRHALFG